MQYFREIGYVDADDNPVHFSDIVLTGSHDNGTISVIQGTLDAATSWYYSLNAGNHTRMIGNNLMEEGDIRFIYQSEIVPNAAFAALTSLPEEMRAQMSACFVNMQFTHPEEFERVVRDVFAGFGLVSNEVYQPFIDLRRASR